MDEGLSIACVVHDRELAEAHLLRSLDGLSTSTPVARIILDNEANVLGRDIARLYNTLLRIEGPRYRMFCHPDLAFPGDFAEKVSSALRLLEEEGRPWGALGVVGRAWSGSYTWAHEVEAPTPVCSLDSCCIVVDTSQALTFDARTFDEFHCYVEDYCLQCHSQDLGVFVIPAEFSHVGATFEAHGSNWGRYRRYRRRLDRKWKHRFDRILTT